MALLEGLHAPRARLGAVLAESGFSELRFERLLRAHGEALWDAVRRMAHFLASKAASVNQADIAWLVLSDDRSDAERVRRRLARHFYGALHRAQSTA
jgi:CRISPR system Cascade subunit CasB